MQEDDRWFWADRDLNPSGQALQISVPPSATSRLLYELLGGVRLGFLVLSPCRIACVFLHVERGRSYKRVWSSSRIMYFLRPSQGQSNPLLDSIVISDEINVECFTGISNTVFVSSHTYE
jgi:hypothetical protein